MLYGGHLEHIQMVLKVSFDIENYFKSTTNML